MLDTVGAEMQVVNKSEKSISLQQDDNVILTPDKGQEASSQVLPINFNGLAKVRTPLPCHHLHFTHISFNTVYVLFAGCEEGRHHFYWSILVHWK